MHTSIDEYTLIERMPTAAEYSALRSSVRWSVLDPIMTQEALDSSIYGCCLLDKDRVIGTGRIVGDYQFYVYLQDIIIDPEFQHQGCGRQIMNHLLSYLAQNAPSGAFIGMFSGHNIDSIMAKYSFVRDSFQHMSKGLFFVKK